MSMEAAAAKTAGLLSPFEQLRYRRDIIHQESRSLVEVAERLDGGFCRAVDLIFGCRGSVIVSAMGKAGLVGQKVMPDTTGCLPAAVSAVKIRATSGEMGHWLTSSQRHPALQKTLARLE